MNHTVKFLFTWDSQPYAPVVSAIQVGISEEKVWLSGNWRDCWSCGLVCEMFQKDMPEAQIM